MNMRRIFDDTPSKSQVVQAAIPQQNQVARIITFKQGKVVSQSIIEMADVVRNEKSAASTPLYDRLTAVKNASKHNAPPEIPVKKPRIA